MAATDPKTITIPELTPTEKQWVHIALKNTRDAMERARNKYPAGSTMYTAVTRDIDSLATLKEKFA